MTEKAPVKHHRYTEGIGRRKTAVARVRITKGTGATKVNDHTFAEYFPTMRRQAAAIAPLRELKLEDQFDVQAHVKGGGPNAQAEAVRHGLARALLILDETLRDKLHVLGYLTRDSRMVERKKYGLKKARRAPQWKKR